MEKVLEIKNNSGLHARPSGLLAKTASSYKSDITLTYNGKTTSAKSIMNVLSLGLKYQNQVTLNVTGEDEEEAFKAIVDLFESGFGEM